MPAASALFAGRELGAVMPGRLCMSWDYNRHICTLAVIGSMPSPRKKMLPQAM